MAETEPTKRCTKCKQLKPHSMFYADRSAGDGRTRWCKACQSEYNKLPEVSARKRINDRESSYRAGRRQPYYKNKSSGVWLGVHVAERVLRHVFSDVEPMPFGNTGFDFVCNKGHKVDSKASCRQKRAGRSDWWEFRIERNTMADYFALIAFDNRDDLTPEHFWIVPGDLVNSKTSLRISVNRTREWAEFEKPIGAISSCCDILKKGEAHV